MKQEHADICIHNMLSKFLRDLCLAALVFLSCLIHAAEWHYNNSNNNKNNNCSDNITTFIFIFIVTMLRMACKLAMAAPYPNDQQVGFFCLFGLRVLDIAAGLAAQP